MLQSFPENEEAIRLEAEGIRDGLRLLGVDVPRAVESFLAEPDESVRSQLTQALEGLFEESEPLAFESMAREATPEASRGGLDCMVVEDDRAMRMYIVHALQSRGHYVRSYDNAEDALAATRDQIPDIMVVDVNLPGMDGLELCQKIRKGPDGAVPRILVSTSQRSDQTIQRVQAAGADDFIAKPLQPALLSLRIATLENGASSRRPQIDAPNISRRFKILEQVSRGGTADVYRAIDSELGEEVALKLFTREWSMEPRHAVRIKREVKAARRVQSRQVARVFELGRWEGRYFLTMEFVKGRPLQEVLREGPMNLNAVWLMTRDILVGLSDIHVAGIIHRDIKPANIMVEPSWRTVILDLGVAWSENDSSLTSEGGFVGTPRYASPEQVRGHALSPASDLYSLGCLLYEVCTGSPLFMDLDPAKLILARAANGEPTAGRIELDVPEDVGAFVKKCLEPIPARRFDHAGEALEAWMGIEETLQR